MKRMPVWKTQSRARKRPGLSCMQAPLPYNHTTMDAATHGLQTVVSKTALHEDLHA